MDRNIINILGVILPKKNYTNKWLSKQQGKELGQYRKEYGHQILASFLEMRDIDCLNIVMCSEWIEIRFLNSK